MNGRRMCEGINLVNLPIGQLLKIGKEALVRVSQIGKDAGLTLELTREFSA